MARVLGELHCSIGRTTHGKRQARRLWLSGDGARVARLAAGEEREPADASAWGTSSDLVLVFYGRMPLDSLKLAGDRRVFDRLIEWTRAHSGG